MMITFKNLTKSNEKEWNKFIDSCDNGSPLHKISFIKFQKENNQEVNGFLFYNNNNKLIGTIAIT